MNGKSGSISATSVGTTISASGSARVQVAQELQLDGLELIELVVVEVSFVLVGLSLVLTDEGFPSSPIVRGGNPLGGGTMPPPTTPAAGITMMPTPGPTYQIGKIVV